MYRGILLASSVIALLLTVGAFASAYIGITFHVPGYLSRDELIELLKKYKKDGRVFYILGSNMGEHVIAANRAGYDTYGYEIAPFKKLLSRPAYTLSMLRKSRIDTRLLDSVKDQKDVCVVVLNRNLYPFLVSTLEEEKIPVTSIVSVNMLGEKDKKFKLSTGKEVFQIR